MSQYPNRRQFLAATLAVPVGAAVATTTARFASLSNALGMNRRARSAPQHVAVVGAGAFGGWTALHLLRSGIRVTLIDAWGAGNPRASSGGDTRVIRALYGGDRIYIDWVARSFELWKASEDAWHRPLHVPTGALWMFRGDNRYARAALPLMRDAGFAIEELTPSAAARRYPQISFEGIRSCYWEERAGYLFARDACEAVRRAVVAEGGEYRQLHVRPGPIAGNELTSLSLSDGSKLVADQYVFACGPWLGRVFPHAVGDLVLPTRQELYFFGPPAGDGRYLDDKMPVWVDFGERVFYGIPGRSQHGFKVADDTRGAVVEPSSMDRTPSSQGIAWAKRFVAFRFPGLARAPIVETQVCQYENSPDGHYIVDRHPLATNAWLVGGGSGHGFKVGPALGEHVAKLVRGEATVYPLFAMARFGSRSRVTPRRTQTAKP